MVEVMDRSFQQVANGHSSPRKIVRPQELLEPAENAFNDSVVSRCGYSGHALFHIVLLKKVGITGRGELRSLIAMQDELGARWAFPR